MNSTYSYACSLGYPYIRGNPKVVDGVLCNRFTRFSDEFSAAVYVGSRDGRGWIVELEDTATQADRFALALRNYRLAADRFSASPSSELRAELDVAKTELEREREALVESPE